MAVWLETAVYLRDLKCFLQTRKEERLNLIFKLRVVFVVVEIKGSFCKSSSENT